MLPHYKSSNTVEHTKMTFLQQSNPQSQKLEWQLLGREGERNVSRPTFVPELQTCMQTLSMLRPRKSDPKLPIARTHSSLLQPLHSLSQPITVPALVAQTSKESFQTPLSPSHLLNQKQLICLCFTVLVHTCFIFQITTICQSPSLPSIILFSTFCQTAHSKVPT